MLKFKLSYHLSFDHSYYTTFEVHKDIELFNSLSSSRLSIKGSGTVESPYKLTLSYNIKRSYPKITIYDSDSYLQVRGSNYYGVIVTRSKNVSLCDSKFRNLWIENTSNVRIKDLIVRGKVVLWKCENAILDNSQIKLLYASKNENISISNCRIKTLRTKKDDLENPQITNTQVGKFKTTESIPIAT